MELLLDKPAGTIIQGREDVEGLTLFWTQPSPRLIRYGAAVFHGLFLCFWAAVTIFMIAQVVIGGPEIEGGGQVFLVVWLVLWMLGGLFIGWTFWSLIRPARPDAVTLGKAPSGTTPGPHPSCG